jgi:hypothetical protein
MNMRPLLRNFEQSDFQKMTVRERVSLAANSGNRSSFPSAQRNSIATFFPSTNPDSAKPFRNPAFGAGSRGHSQHARSGCR